MSTPPLTPLAAAALHVGAPERVLQIECGEGDAALFLSREFPSARIRAVDRSEAAIRAAAARVGLDPEGRIAFKVGRPRDLPYPDDHFDLVAILDTRAAAAEAARVLRPGGFLALVDTARAVPATGIRTAFSRWRLARSGFEPIWSEAAGDGSFAVMRLATGRPGQRSV